MGAMSGKVEDIPIKKETGIVQSEPGYLLTPFAEMERWVKNFFPRSWWPQHGLEWPTGEGRMPKVDVIDRDDEILVKAELPGVDKPSVDKKDIEYR